MIKTVADNQNIGEAAPATPRHVQFEENEETEEGEEAGDTQASLIVNGLKNFLEALGKYAH